MKSRTKQSLMKRVNNQGSFTTTCKPFDTGTSYQLLHRAIWQHLSIVLFLLLSGAGFGTATAQAQTLAYVTVVSIVTGLAFGTAFLLSGSLWLPSAMHAAFDVTAVLLIYWNLETTVVHSIFR